MSFETPTLLNSTADAIVVYQHRARVRRVAELDASLLAAPTNGEVQVLVALPESFERDSVQVEFNQLLAQHASLGGVTVEELEEEGDLNDENASQKRRQQLEERVKELNKQIAYVDQDMKEVDATLSFVEDVVNGGLDPKNAVLLGSDAMWRRSTWESQLSALEEARRTHGESRYKLECRQKELREELQTVQRELRPYQSGGRLQKKKREAVRIVLSVEQGESATGGELKLYVSYMIPQAFWEAAYEVHLDTKKNSIQVFYNARVTLHRGEDFSNVHLTLCSTAPRHLGREPELTPWRCGLTDPAPAPAPSSSSTVAEAKNMAVRCYSAAPMAAAPAAMEEVSGGVANFVIPNPVSIKADGEARRFPLIHLTFAAEVEYASVPALDTAVYTKVQSTNDSEFLLLPGRASLFLDGDFLCNSHLPRSAPGGKLSIDFGVDRSIELKRVLLTELTAAQKSRLTWDNDKVIRTFIYRSTVRNHKSAEPVSVCIKEKVPKSSDEALKVRLVEPEALHADEEKAAFDSIGRVELKVTVPPSSTQEVLFGFVVECPTGKTIYGIEDRH